MRIQQGTRVLVTGGASGLGQELCLALARRGARVWVTDLSLEGAERIARECDKAGASETRASSCDVRKASDFEAVRKELEQAWNGLDLLINNAGVAIGGAFEDHSLDNWRWALDINLWGVIQGCHVFYPLMRSARRGVILNIASAAGLLNPPRMSAYNVSKAAVISLSESLRTECEGTGVHVTVACPTFFKSGLLESGRFQGQGTRELAKALFERSLLTAPQVAEACLQAVERQDFYALPMWDGKIMWWLKRMAPRLSSRLWTRVLPKLAQ